MSISQGDVTTFLDADKSVPSNSSMRWTKRNVHVYMSRMPIAYGSVRVGELILLTNIAAERRWIFKILRRRAEILRWDFASPPYRHRNRRACGERFERTVRALEHEHLWHPTEGLDCVRALSGLGNADHARALGAFCGRAKIDVEPVYTAPPPPGEQLAFDDPHH